MKVKINKKGEDTISVEIEGARHTLPNMLREALWEDKDVKSAAYEKRHPYLGNPHIIVKAKNPEKSLKAAVKHTRELFSEFREEFEKAAK